MFATASILTARAYGTQAERVQIDFANAQLFELAAARIISLKNGGVWN